jgi:hypothetical protein
MIGESMRLICDTAVMALAVLVLAGCAPSQQIPSGTTSGTTEAASPVSKTIEEVFAKVDCIVGDPLGTRARVEEYSYGTELERTGTCSPPGSEELVFFYETTDSAAMDAYLASGKLELGQGDALYRDGAVLILVQDAATASKFSEIFESVDY